MSIDRKAALREYKETPRAMGVGVVRNTRNGRCLVVSGPNIPALLNRHEAQLKFGAHPNKSLQADWDSAGREAFAFEVLDTLKPPETSTQDVAGELRVLEAMWMEKLAPYAPVGYHAKPKTAR